MTTVMVMIIGYQRLFACAMSSSAMHSEEPLLGDGGKDIPTSLHRYGTPHGQLGLRRICSMQGSCMKYTYVRLVHRSLTG